MKILVAARVGSQYAIDAVVVFPWPQGSEIHVLSVAEFVQPLVVGTMPEVIDATEVQAQVDADAQDSAESSASQLRSRGFSAKGFSMEGDPETAILDHAQGWGADLIVVGSHERSRLSKLLTGSVSENIVKHAKCSVLVLRQGE